MEQSRVGNLVYREPLKIFNALEFLEAALVRHHVDLRILVAETGLWANPAVHQRLLSHGTAAFFPNRRRFRKANAESRGQRLGDLILDDNSYANNAIKQAIGVPRQNLVGFEACHIWPRSCYDERYHTAISNLVLLPRSLAGLTDHSPDVQLALQYRAFELYGWHPVERVQPAKPIGYPTNWLDPMPTPNAVRVATHTAYWDGGVASPVHLHTGRDLARYDVIGSDQSFCRLPKRITMLRLIQALWDAGATPDNIYAVLPKRGRRLFASADGCPDSKAFVEKMNSDRQRVGKTFDSARYFCQTDQLLHFAGRTFALTNQWGDWTAETIDALLRAFPELGVLVKRSGSCESKCAGQ
jgi:hypothetical protein